MSEPEVRARECGCTEGLDPEFDAWFLLGMCAEHAASAPAADHGARRVLDDELDQFVLEAAGGHRVQRIRPRDETKR